MRRAVQRHEKSADQLSARIERFWEKVITDIGINESTWKVMALTCALRRDTQRTPPPLSGTITDPPAQMVRAPSSPSSRVSLVACLSCFLYNAQAISVALTHSPLSV